MIEAELEIRDRILRYLTDRFDFEIEAERISRQEDSAGMVALPAGRVVFAPDEIQKRFENVQRSQRSSIGLSRMRGYGFRTPPSVDPQARPQLSQSRRRAPEQLPYRTRTTNSEAFRRPNSSTS